MTKGRRGLTLVEVVAAAALLTLIVVACLPLLTGARRDLEASARTARRAPTDEFDDAVDELIRQRPGLIEELLDQPGGLHQRWTVRDHDYEAEVRLGVQVVATDDEHRSSHAWAVFRFGVIEVPRWLRLPSPQTPKTHTASTLPTPHSNPRRDTREADT